MRQYVTSIEGDLEKKIIKLHSSSFGEKIISFWDFQELTIRN